MIDYNFVSLIDNKNFVGIPLIQNILNQIPTSLDDNDFIDKMWNQIISDSYFPFSGASSDIIALLKKDILWSLYTSAKYSSLEGFRYNEIMKKLDEENPDVRKKFDDYRSDLRKIYSSQNAMLTSGQFFQRNPIDYFKPFWEENDSKIKYFNLKDYVAYIETFKHWPFLPKNYEGISFFEYFTGIHLIIGSWINCADCSMQEVNFQNSFSAYILEELLSPINFIQNIHLYISKFKDVFYDKDFNHEKVIVLMQPLFKLPMSLWKKSAEYYISSIRNYIEKPSQNTEIALFRDMYQMILNYQYNDLGVKRYILFER